VSTAIAYSLGDRTRTYVGEAEAYVARFRQYARPGPSQTTNLRMRTRLERLLGEYPGTADIDVARRVVVRIEGAEADLGALPGPFLRRLVENAALIAAAARGDELVRSESRLRWRPWTSLPISGRAG
jgi:hypothetical protein